MIGAKAVFIPLILVLIGWLLVSNYVQNKEKPTTLVLNFHSIKKIIYGTLLFGGWWYLERWLYFGHQGISIDFLRLNQAGGGWTQLGQNFSWHEVLFAIKNTWSSWHWMGGWSMIDLPGVAMLPFLLMDTALIVLTLRFLQTQDLHSLYVFFVTFGLCLMCFLVSHMLIAIALHKTTAWGKYGVYFQDFMPITVWFIVALLSFYARFLRRWQLKLAMVILGFFKGFAIWSMLAVFGGCAIKLEDRQIGYSDNYFCLTSMTQIWQTNGVLTNIEFSIFLLVIGFTLMLILARNAINALCNLPEKGC